MRMTNDLPEAKHKDELAHDKHGFTPMTFGPWPEEKANVRLGCDSHLGAVREDCA
jgi:hypothetical protein